MSLRNSRRNGRRQRNPVQQRQRAVRRGRQSLDKVPPAALAHVCGMLDPFCEHSLSAKVPSEGSFRTVTANISDFATHSVLADVTTGDNYIASRYSAGLDANIVDNATMNNSVITVATRSDSAYQTTLTDASLYRVVACGLKIRYTGAPISASGFFRIYKLASGFENGTVGGSWPDQLSDITGLYWDYTPQELAKGVTVFMNRNQPKSKEFIALTSSHGFYFEAVAIIGVGLDADATITTELRQTLELQPVAGTTASLVATPNHTPIPAVEHALSQTASKLTHPVLGPVKAVGEAVVKHASSGIWSAIKQFGSQALDSIPGMIESGLEWAGESLLPLVEEAGMGALALL